jgi:hypothetical protein
LHFIMRVLKYNKVNLPNLLIAMILIYKSGIGEMV